MGPAAPGSAGPDKQAGFQDSPANWREALVGLVTSRIALIQLESKDAARDGAKRAVLVLITLGCVFFGWILLLAATVSLIAGAFGWPWDRVALALGGIHLLVAFICLKMAKPSGNPTFPITRAEFQKDREWIEKFQKNRKSNG